MDIEKLHNMISEMSADLGFSIYAATPSEMLTDEMSLFKDYLSKKYNGDMSYLDRNCDIRENPDLLLKGAKSVLCFLANYKTDFIKIKDNPKIATYALGKDYHKVIKDKLYAISEKIKEEYPLMNFRVFTDSAPILERKWAAKAGLGFIGKNSMLISKKFGVKTFIGIIITDLVVKYSWSVEKPGCGSCRRCLEACPSGALTKEYMLDARKCISYQTIESKRSREKETFSIDYNGYIFGCDLCIDACPWTEKGELTSIKEFFPDDNIVNKSKEDWMKLTEDEFAIQFKDSPLLRSGLSKIKENLSFNGFTNQI